jgi:hypothetical protein
VTILTGLCYLIICWNPEEAILRHLKERILILDLGFETPGEEGSFLSVLRMTTARKNFGDEQKE